MSQVYIRDAVTISTLMLFLGVLLGGLMGSHFEGIKWKSAILEDRISVVPTVSTTTNHTITIHNN